MQKELTIAIGQHDITVPDPVERGCLDLHDIAGP
jgi:hypothetical protein